MTCNGAIRTRLRAPTTGLRVSPDIKGKMVSTLIKLKNSGLKDGTVRTIGFQLKHLAQHSDLDNPESVKNFIREKKCADSQKINLVKAYNYYCIVNCLEWERPKYKTERKIPKIPTTESIDKIISSASPRYATIFRLLSETGLMPHELSNVTARDIDLEKGMLHVQGFKRHSSRVFKLKDSTLAMLKTYLGKNQKENPFPKSEWICKVYRRFRNNLAKKLGDPSIRTIRLYDFRHYYATMLYHKTKDILYVKQQMGHKKIETTLIYTQLVNFGDQEWTCCVAKNLQEACSLIE